jgi:glycosyltransferase involved in cell wall biosynthesis
MIKVSVVIPTCNRASFLKAAIQSVLNQTFRDFEIIVVDDASEDETPEVIRSFTDPRIRCVRHEANKGQGVTRNDGIRCASGDYIALLDDDDEWLPEKLKKQVSMLDSSPSRVGLIYTGFYRVEGLIKRVIDQFIPQKHGYLYEDLWAQNWIKTCSTVLLRRQCFEKAGFFDEELPSAADYDMWLRISKEFEIEYVAEPLVYYTVHDNRISTNHESKVRGLEALLRKHAPEFARDRQGYSQKYLSLGINYCFVGNIKKGRKAFVQAIRLYPFEIRHYYNFSLSLLGENSFRYLKRIRDRYSMLFR